VTVRVTTESACVMTARVAIAYASRTLSTNKWQP